MEIGEIETAKKRCESVIKTIEKLPSSFRRTLLKLASSELSFLSSLSIVASPHPLSVNIGYIESIVRILRLPFVTGVSRVCKSLSLPIGSVHVDLVCTLWKAPVWIIVSDRNPKYITWKGDSHGSKGLKSKIEHVLAAARSTTTLKPSSVILFFANGLLWPILEKLKDEFGAVDFDFGLDSDSSMFDFECEETMDEGEWVNVVRNRSYKEAVSVEIKLIDQCHSLAFAESEVVAQVEVAELGEFSSFISTMRLKERIVDMPEIELEEKFKGNTVFVIAQARSEIEDPVLVKMGTLLSGRRGIVCESVVSEFKELVSMYGGYNEKHRAEQLLNRLMVMNDDPTDRMMGLLTTRKLAMKNKIVFGTGDRWRAVAQSGMSLSTIEHSPRALTGD